MPEYNSVTAVSEAALHMPGTSGTPGSAGNLGRYTALGIAKTARSGITNDTTELATWRALVGRLVAAVARGH